MRLLTHILPLKLLNIRQCKRLEEQPPVVRPVAFLLYRIVVIDAARLVVHGASVPVGEDAVGAAQSLELFRGALLLTGADAVWVDLQRDVVVALLDWG